MVGESRRDATGLWVPEPILPGFRCVHEWYLVSAFGRQDSVSR